MSGLQVTPTGLIISGDSSVSANPRDFGAKGDGATDDVNALKRAIAALTAAGGGTVLISPGTYLLSTYLDLPSNVTLQGVGLPTLKAAAGSTADPLLIRSNATSDCFVRGIKIDGNRTNVTGFSNVCLIYQATRVVYEDCYFTNCRGIALYNNGSVNSGVRFSKFYDNGTLNRTTSTSSDRKQSYACSSCTAPCWTSATRTRSARFWLGAATLAARLSSALTRSSQRCWLSRMPIRASRRARSHSATGRAR